jgi:arylsulfatase A-like enzyme
MPDQMRGDCLRLAGHPVLLTPNMDEIGRQGAFFPHAYTTCASCIPARRSLLTGQVPASHGMVGYREGVPLRAPTLPQCLRDGGYATAIAGRYMHQWPYEEGYGYEQRILGSTYKQDDAYARWLDEKAPEFGGIRGLGLSSNGWQARPWPLDDHLHPTHWTVQQARQVLAQYRDNRPLFLTTSFYAPHPPLCPPAFYMERYLRQSLPPAAIGDWAIPPHNQGIGAGVDAHRTCLTGEALRSAQAGYFGLINHIDDQLTWLLREFKALSLAQDRPWAILVTSDHGEMLGDHFYFRKCEPYEGASRIPFLVQGSPELNLQPNLTTDQPVSLEDVMPTLLALAELPVPEETDGANLLPLLRGETTEVRPWLHGEHAPCYSQAQAYHFLTDGHVKYIWRPTDGSEQLFDLDHDPQELHNLAQETKWARTLTLWRERMIETLTGRPEGFTDGKRLIPNRPYGAVLPQGN